MSCSMEAGLQPQKVMFTWSHWAICSASGTELGNGAEEFPKAAQKASLHQKRAYKS